MSELERCDHQELLNYLQRALDVAKMGNAKGIVGIGVVRALTTYCGVFRKGREGEIKKLADLLEYHPDYNADDAANQERYDRLLDLLWKDIAAFSKWITIFNRAAKNKNSQYKLVMPRIKRKVKLPELVYKAQQSPMSNSEKKKIAAKKAKADNLTDDRYSNIGQLTIQNSHDVTIAGRDVHINNQTRKSTPKKSAEDYEENGNQ